jgi:hypothetical protein
LDLSNFQIFGPPGCSKTTFFWLHALQTSATKCILWTSFHNFGSTAYVLINFNENTVQRGSFHNLDQIEGFLQAPGCKVCVWYVENVTSANKGPVLSASKRWWMRAPSERTILMCSSLQAMDIPAHYVSMNFRAFGFEYLSDTETMLVLEAYWPHCWQNFIIPGEEAQPTAVFSDESSQSCVKIKRKYSGNKCALFTWISY